VRSTTRSERREERRKSRKPLFSHFSLLASLLAAIGHSRATAAKPMGVHVNGQERFQHGPQFVRDAKAGLGLVVWCTHTGSFGVASVLIPSVYQFFG
jgi:hypothetical protein